MSARRTRLSRMARIAAGAEERARAKWLDASLSVRVADREREAVLERAGRLADADLPAGLRGHLAQTGARHLIALTDERVELDAAAAEVREQFDSALTRSRALERLVARLDAEEKRRRQRLMAVELADLVASRAVRSSR